MRLSKSGHVCQANTSKYVYVEENLPRFVTGAHSVDIRLVVILLLCFDVSFILPYSVCISKFSLWFSNVASWHHRCRCRRLHGPSSQQGPLGSRQVEEGDSIADSTKIVVLQKIVRITSSRTYVSCLNFGVELSNSLWSCVFYCTCAPDCSIH